MIICGYFVGRTVIFLEFALTEYLLLTPGVVAGISDHFNLNWHFLFVYLFLFWRCLTKKVSNPQAVELIIVTMEKNPFSNMERFERWRYGSRMVEKQIKVVVRGRRFGGAYESWNALMVSHY